jgi:hypothetical protein
MKKVIGIAALMSALALSTTAFAGADCAPGPNAADLESFYGTTGSPTPSGVVSNLGGAISGGFYGNTSNAGLSPYAPANKHGVTPSESPGPQVLGVFGPGTGPSVGDYIQACNNAPAP